MDKLKALQYVLAAAQTGSLSAAARQQGVSLQAVAKLVGAPEAQVGATLFQRGSRGLKLTSDGVHYAEACAPLLAQLQAVDDGLRQARQRPQGTLVVGGTTFILQHCIVPALPAFHDSWPELTLDLRNVVHLDEAVAKDCDLLLHGWYEAGDWVRRELPVMPHVTVATPAYWKAHGIPRHPRDLAEIALADQGVMRVSHAVEHANLASGRLVPVLLDWELMDPAPLALYFRPEQRRLSRLQRLRGFLLQ